MNGKGEWKVEITLRKGRFFGINFWLDDMKRQFFMVLFFSLVVSAARSFPAMEITEGYADNSFTDTTTLMETAHQNFTPHGINPIAGSLTTMGQVAASSSSSLAYLTSLPLSGVVLVLVGAVGGISLLGKFRHDDKCFYWRAGLSFLARKVGCIRSSYDLPYKEEGGAVGYRYSSDQTHRPEKSNSSDDPKNTQSSLRTFENPIYERDQNVQVQNISGYNSGYNAPSLAEG